MRALLIPRLCQCTSRRACLRVSRQAVSSLSSGWKYPVPCSPLASLRLLRTSHERECVTIRESTARYISSIGNSAFLSASQSGTASQEAAHIEEEGLPQGGASSGLSDSSECTSSLCSLQLHNLPKNWLHEEIIGFIDQVAKYAGIEAPLKEPDRTSDASGVASSDDGSAIPRAHSPFVKRLKIPFGRRTGIVYGSPLLELTSPKLVHYLLHDLSFSPDDYRNRIYFTEFKPAKTPSESTGLLAGRESTKGSTTFMEVEDTIEEERAEALRTLELDRYLLAPDLLLDIAKMHQRRLVTRSERIVLDAFTDGKEDGECVGDDSQAAVQGSSEKRQRTTGSRRKKHAGAYKHLGRGSSQNISIPKPYVSGRPL